MVKSRTLCLKMSFSCSSSINGSQMYHALFGFYSCTIGWYIYLVFDFINIVLLLPLSVSILYLGFQQRKHQRSSAAATSLSEFVTYNMAVMELIGVSGCAVFLCGNLACLPELIWQGMLIGSFPWSGQTLFPMLTCVERYMAVVHPITYLSLKKGSGVRIRNIFTVCVWLQCFAGPCFATLMMDHLQYIFIPSACQMVIFLIAMSYCSLSVLCTLIRPRPGEAAGDGARVHQSKRRAFHTILLIMGVLLLKFGGNLFCNVMGSLTTIAPSAQCAITMSLGWFNLPSSLVLPLLFLHKTGNLPGCKHGAESG